MAFIGDGLRGGLFRRLHEPVNPAGLWWALGIALILAAVLQGGMGIIAGVAAAIQSSDTSDERGLTRLILMAVFPAAILTAIAAFYLARIRGGRPREVLCLGWPQFGFIGWPIVISGFMLAMYAAMIAAVFIFGIDLGQYTPGPDGQTPETGSTGIVKEAMFDIANEPLLLLLTLPSVVLGAPIAEELIFRGQLFSALSRTWLGYSGTTLVTAALWASLHTRANPGFRLP